MIKRQCIENVKETPAKTKSYSLKLQEQRKNLKCANIRRTIENNSIYYKSEDFARFSQNYENQN